MKIIYKNKNFKNNIFLILIWLSNQEFSNHITNNKFGKGEEFKCN